jgi:zinc/manganese transport system substrate-binding protein
MANPPGRSRTGMYAAVVVIILVVAVAAGLYLTGNLGGSGTSTNSSTGSSGGSVIQVVAAENFWGSLTSQIGGSHVNVTSIVSDPNTDPHQYQANPSVARAISGAKLVVINGMNYDTWAGQIINASTNSGQTVINAQQVVHITNDQLENINPHLWYSPYYVNDTNHAIYNALVKIDPTDQAYFKSNYAALNSSLYHAYMLREKQISAQFGGKPVAATESIFIFMANATGLNLISPQGFMKAVAEGNDPTPADIATFQSQLNGGNKTVGCFVYNVQTVSPVTVQLKALAAQNQIPITQVSETIQPPDLPFQNWMQAEVANLQNCLNAAALLG